MLLFRHRFFSFSDFHVFSANARYIWCVVISRLFIICKLNWIEIWTVAWSTGQSLIVVIIIINRIWCVVSQWKSFTVSHCDANSSNRLSVWPMRPIVSWYLRSHWCWARVMAAMNQRRFVISVDVYNRQIVNNSPLVICCGRDHCYYRYCYYSNGMCPWCLSGCYWHWHFHSCHCSPAPPENDPCNRLGPDVNCISSFRGALY